MKMKEYRFGNAILEVHDRYFCNPEEVEKTIKRIGKINDKKPLKKDKRASA